MVIGGLWEDNKGSLIDGLPSLSLAMTSLTRLPNPKSIPSQPEPLTFSIQSTHLASATITTRLHKPNHNPNPNHNSHHSTEASFILTTYLSDSYRSLPNLNSSPPLPYLLTSPSLPAHLPNPTRSSPKPYLLTS